MPTCLSRAWARLRQVTPGGRANIYFHRQPARCTGLSGGAPPLVSALVSEKNAVRSHRALSFICGPTGEI
jgi:hypothetical protein